ncbi:MAG: protoheme IX farnesyltransferase [Candidatus Nomurabacteria bacterium]|nr:MAG: protoheme IX farnesyltransferase [Candidatus Nomurabacteria bacterium]
MERRTKSYLQLIKPGITLSNSMTAAAGFFLAASQFGFSWSRFAGTIGGVALIIASACVVNNIYDRNIDAKMSRTKGREIASGHITLQMAALYAMALGSLGLWLLYTFTNQTTVLLGLLSYFWYVVVYSVAKRTTPLSTVIGAVCGALPPMAGYAALAGKIDDTAWVLFWVLMVWQLPHFYAIAIFRENDYRKANLPVWSVLLGAENTKAQILFWVAVFTIVVALPSVIGATGNIYLTVMLALSVYWLAQGVWYYRREKTDRWAKRMFGISLVVLLTFCAMISVGGIIA